MFIGELDLRAHGHREWLVLAPFAWESPRLHVVVPRGFVTDLASIPRPLRGFLDINGPSRYAATIHDFCYCYQRDAYGNRITRELADQEFRAGLEAKGVNIVTRNIYYSGVRAGGWVYWGKREKEPLNNEYDFAPVLEPA